MNPTNPNKEYTVSLNLDDVDQLVVQKTNGENDAEEGVRFVKYTLPLKNKGEFNI